MARRKTSIRRRHDRGSSGITWSQVEILMTGSTFEHGDGAAFESEAHRAKAWSFNRRQIMAWWLSGIPASEPYTPGLHAHLAPRKFCRPWAWWRYDAPERRQILDRSQHQAARLWAMAEACALDAKGAAEDANFFGTPAFVCGGGGFEVETEEAYLRRLNLLEGPELPDANIISS